MNSDTHPVAFFSYSRDDSAFVLQLAKDLKASGAAVWLDQLDIKPGEHWDNAIQSALEHCTSMLLILSPSSVASSNVMDEVSYAIDEGRLIIPVLHRTCNIPFRLRRVQYIDTQTDYPGAVRELADLLASGEAGNAERDRRINEQQARLAEQGRADGRQAAPPMPAAHLLEQTSKTPLPMSWLAGGFAILALVAGIVVWQVSRKNVVAPTTPSVSMPDATASTKMGKPDITEWVKAYLKATEGPGVNGLHALVEANVAPYYSLASADWATIENDKEGFFSKFPEVHNTLIGDPIITSQSDNEAVVEVDFQYSNVRKNGQRADGRSHIILNLHLEDGQWKLAGIHEKVF
jgi:hypothetical protein